MKIIEAGLPYCDILAEIHKMCFDKPWSSDFFKKTLTNKFNKVYLATDDDNNAMGFVLFQQIDLECELLTICTAPHHRKKGVAKSLLQKIDATRVFLEVNENNLKAVNLYEKLGFEVKSIRKKYYENGDNALVMERDFTKDPI